MFSFTMKILSGSDGKATLWTLRLSFCGNFEDTDWLHKSQVWLSRLPGRARPTCKIEDWTGGFSETFDSFLHWSPLCAVSLNNDLEFSVIIKQVWTSVKLCLFERVWEHFSVEWKPIPSVSLEVTERIPTAQNSVWTRQQLAVQKSPKYVANMFLCLIFYDLSQHNLVWLQNKCIFFSSKCLLFI